MDTKRHRSSEKQLDYMIDFMLKHNKFASGKFQGIKGKTFLKDTWERLSNELNEIGPKKTVDQWKKAWKNQKLLTRKRNSEIKLARKKTGNYTPPLPLTDRENKIINIIGKESSEGLGFSEGAIGESALQAAVTNLEETMDITQDIPTNIEESENLSHEDVIENIYIVNEGEIGFTESFISNKESQEKEVEQANISKKSDIKEMSKPRSIAAQENELFRNLVHTNQSGLTAIARSLELLAEANNNIADAIKSLNNISNQ